MESGNDNDAVQQKHDNNNEARFHHASRSLPIIPISTSQSRAPHIPATQAFSDTGPLTQHRSNIARPSTNGYRPDSGGYDHDTDSEIKDSNSKDKVCSNGIHDLSALENALNNAMQDQDGLNVYVTSVTNVPDSSLVDLTKGASSPKESVYFDALADPRQATDPSYVADYDNYNNRPKKRSLKTKSKQQSNGNGGESESYYEDAEESTGCLKTSHTRSKSKMGVSHAHSGVKVFRKGGERRKRIPDRPNQSMSLWSILKNSLGKDLSKISMPVNFSEPLSMLQRLTEDYEYSHILDTAAECTDSCQQLCYVAAFTVSSYGTTAMRTAKPFNPMLGETFECDRTEDRGWRCISEQVSHHPPTAALYCEGKGWTCWQDFTMSSKFRGNSLEIVPLGLAHLTFTESGNHYTWRKVTTVVHNIVLGKLWVDQVGDMVIKNHKTGDTCQLKYHPTTFFGKTPKQVTGTVSTARGFAKWNLVGSWNERLVATSVSKTSDKVSESKSTKTMSGSSGTLHLWNIKLPAPAAAKYYDFTDFACQLNEPEVGVAPTDSRLRPDQRLMEDGRWDEANLEKSRLEDKQRAAKKKRELEAGKHTPGGTAIDSYEPIWFSKEFDSSTATKMFKYNSEYWVCKKSKDWKRCPNIYGA